MALPHARVLLHQPATDVTHGQTSDIEIQARELLRIRAQLETLLARHTGRDPEEVRHAIERDRYLDAESARAYGLVDDVIARRERPAYAARTAA
jgi:ATP-dependent Clp protease protease subunit